MSNVVSASNPLTTSEVALIEALNALPTSGVNQGIAKTGPSSFSNVTFSGGGSSGFQQTVSGSVDGSNTIFGFTTAPNAVCVDNGRTIQKVSSDGTVNWTGTTTITLAIAPTFDIFAVA